ncbi:MAG: FAD binding domain-containing protein [Actinomycetota bacterium]
MPSVLAYHRPTSLDEAATLLAGPRRRALAGGTVVVADVRKNRAEGVEVVDLQDLGLDTIEDTTQGAGQGRMRLGAMVRLADVATDARCPSVLREAARRELPSALRNQATIGGTAAQGDITSLVVAALLVHDAQVHFHGSAAVALGEYLRDEHVRGGRDHRRIVAVTIESGGSGAIAATGRTPADVPIVAAVARSSAAGLRLALTGVASTPIEVDPSAPVVGLNPPADFRGSAEFRAHLAAVLSARALLAVA